MQHWKSLLHVHGAKEVTLFAFDADRNHFNYPTGLQGRSARPNQKSVSSLVWWANRNDAARCSAERERNRLVELVR